MKHTFKALLIASAFTTSSLHATSDTILETVSNPHPATVSTLATLDTHSPSLQRLPFLIFSNMFGYAHTTFDIGWVKNTKDLAALALTSKKFHTLIQPILNVIKERRTNLVIRAFLGTVDFCDTLILRLFNIYDIASFDGLLDLALGRKLPTPEITDTVNAALITRIDDDASLNAVYKPILIRALPNATPMNLFWGVWEARNLDYGNDQNILDYNYGISAKLYESIANHKDATPRDILSAASGLYRLNKSHFYKVIELYENIINHKDAVGSDFCQALDELTQLRYSHSHHSEERDHLKNKSIAFAIKCANHTNASSQAMLAAARLLDEYGSPYNDGSADIYERAANHPEASASQILVALKKLYRFSSNKSYLKERQFCDICAPLYERAANHPEADPTIISEAAAELIKLDSNMGYFKQRQRRYILEYIYIRLANHQKTTSYYIMQAAQGLIKNVNPDHPMLAELYERAINCDFVPNCNIREAALGFFNLGKNLNISTKERKQFHDKAAGLLERFAKYVDKHQIKISFLDTRIATDELFKLGNSFPKDSTERKHFHDKITELFDFFANHPETSPYDISNDAHYLVTKGKTATETSENRKHYHDQAANLFEHAANHAKTTFWIILRAAEALSELGAEYQERAAILFEKSANHPSATPENIQLAEKSLRALGNEYTENSEDR